MNVNKNGTPDRHQNAGVPGTVPQPSRVPPYVAVQGQTQSPSPDQCPDYIMDDRRLEDSDTKRQSPPTTLWNVQPCVLSVFMQHHATLPFHLTPPSFSGIYRAGR